MEGTLQLMDETYSTESRILWVDIAKGIAILLVVAGHTVGLYIHGSLIRGLIFSFHMPLFFILSGFTLHYSDDERVYYYKLFKLAKKLLLPVIIIWLIRLVYGISMEHNLTFQPNFWKGQIYSLIVGSGVPEKVLGIEVPALGMPWFLYVLFFGRLIFDYIHFKIKKSEVLFWYLVLCLSGILFGQILRMPFSLDLVLTILPFLYFGKWLSDEPCVLFDRKWPKLMIALGIWLVTLFLQFPSYETNTYLELATRRYPLFPLCFITAIAGSMVVMIISIFLSQLKRLSQPLVYIGRYSLVFFLTHCLDFMWKNLWFVEGHQMISLVYRILLDSIVFIFAVFFKNSISLILRRTSS